MTNISSPLILDITTEYSNTDISTAYSNVSGEEDGASKSSGFVGMIILMFILALLLNSVAIFSLIRSSTYHHWNSFYRLLLCLTLTDTLGSITSFPVLLVTYAHNLDWQGGQPVCDYVGFMISFSFLSSAAFVGAMSLERFLGVWAPLLFNDKTTRENRTSALIVVIWSFVFILALCPIVGFGEYVIQYPGSWCFYNFRATGANKIYSLVYSVIWLLVITCTVLCNSLVIVKLVQRFVIQRRRATHGNRKIGRSTRNELFSVILLFVIVVVTVTCGIPLAVSYSTRNYPYYLIQNINIAHKHCFSIT